MENHETKVEQLLTVWNPYFHPQTIQVHVEALRKNGKVWWGRLYRGRELNEEEAKAKFAEVRRIAGEAEAAGRDLVLFATNHVQLHALRVDQVRFGSTLPEEERPFVLSYYRELEARPALWFRVLDVRALSFDQLETLRYFFDSGEVEAGLIGFDPFAAYKWEYPIVVRGPAAERLFDPSLLRGRARLHAHHAETLFPPEVQRARREVGRRLGPLWERLEEKSRHFLASGWLVHSRYGSLRDFDRSSSFSGVARAVETELCEATIGPWVDRWRLRRAIFGGGRLTLGAVERALDELAALGEEKGAGALVELAGNRQWRRWLRRFVELRNEAAHPSMVRASRFSRAWEEVVSTESRLLPLVEAKERLSQTKGPPPWTGEGPFRALE